METTPQIFLQGITLPEFIDQVRAAILNAPGAVVSPDGDGDLINSKEVMQLLHISHTTLCRYRREGLLPFTKKGNKVFHSRAAVLQAFKGS